MERTSFEVQKMPMGDTRLHNPEPCHCKELQQCVDEFEAEEEKTALENVILRNALEIYATHGNKVTCIMCEQSKHSKYPCTCGLEQVRNSLENK